MTTRGAVDFVPKAYEVYSAKEVATHGTSAAEAWGILNGKVYNLTRFSQKSCQGKKILQYAGREFPAPSNEHELANCFLGYLKGSLEARKEIAMQGFETPPVYHDRNHTAGKVDLSKPLVAQILSLTKQEYNDLSMEYVCTTEPAQFFTNPWLELLSRTKWWVIPLVWIPVAAIGAVSSQKTYNLSWSFVYVAVILGIFIWTFAEYCVHRFVFHFSEGCLPDIPAVRLAHFLVHGVHHFLPMDPMRLVMPPALLTVLMAPFYMVLKSFVPLMLLLPVWSGILIGYVVYDMLHYAEHHFPIYGIPYLSFMKRYHMKHHFRHPLLGFGVSSPLWDIVFNTTI